MTYDDEMETRYERQEREYVAEQTRIRDEARTAFAKVDGLAVAQKVAARLPRRPVMPLYRQITAERQAQVQHAASVLRMLGEDGYALVGSL